MNFTPENIPFMIAGLLLCFGGWWLFRASVFFMGLILGASFGYALAAFVVKAGLVDVPGSWLPWVIIVSMILFGLLGIWLIKKLLKVLLFIGGFLFGILISAFYAGIQVTPMQPDLILVLVKNLPLWSVALGIGFGILFVFFEKAFIILYTCAVGSYLIMSRTGAPVYLFYGLLVIGALVQFRVSKGTRVKDMKIIKD